MKKFLGVTMLAIIMAQMSWAVPSLRGTNGLINMPAASSIKYKEFDLGFNWELLQTSSSSKHQLHYLANLGIFEGVEMGIVGDTSKEGSFINIKYFMMSDKSQYPLSLAVGAMNITSHSNTDLYLVMSKKFPNNLAAHFGFKSNILASQIKADVMFGMEMFLSQYVTIIGDIIGEMDVWNVSAGARIKLFDDILFNLYLEDVAGATTSKTTFTFGFTFHSLMQ